MICSTDGCNTPLGSKNKSGRCRSCTARKNNADPVFRQKRAEAVRFKYATDPTYRADARRRAGEVFKRPDVREKGRAAVLRSRNWEKALAAITPETIAKRARTHSNNRLAHIPSDYRDLYRHLRRDKHLTAADATRICLEQQEHDRRAMHREWGVAA